MKANVKINRINEQNFKPTKTKIKQKQPWVDNKKLNNDKRNSKWTTQHHPIENGFKSISRWIQWMNFIGQATHTIKKGDKPIEK